MKNFGSVCDFAHERSADLLNAYFSCIRTCHYVRMPDIFKAVVEMPSRRFWISAPRAAVVIAAMERGDDLSSMRPNKCDMFSEIFRRYKSLRISSPQLRSHISSARLYVSRPQSFISPHPPPKSLSLKLVSYGSTKIRKDCWHCHRSVNPY